MPIIDKNIKFKIMAIIQSYNMDVKVNENDYIVKDLDINGSDPIELMMELEKEFSISFYDDLERGIEEKNLTILGIQIYSKKYEYVRDVKVSELIKIISSKL